LVPLAVYSVIILYARDTFSPPYVSSRVPLEPIESDKTF